MDKSENNMGDPATNSNGVDIGKPEENVAKGQHAASAFDDQKSHKRTLGLKLYDVFLYPFFTHFTVFGLSVAATYLTSRGKNHPSLGKFGEFFQARGDRMVKRLKSMGMSTEQANMSKTVFFSYLDGSLVAPFVKMFEDRRESISKWLDTKFGTKPDDESVYEKEPKQTWGSVLAGRFSTATLVIATAYTLDKAGLNDKLFREPGEKVGEMIAQKPKLAKWFGNIDTKEFFKVSFFEFFYTAVCTFGLYISSRFFAVRNGKHKTEALPDAKALPLQDIGPVTDSSAEPEPIVLSAETNPIAKSSALNAKESLKHERPTQRPPEQYTDKYQESPEHAYQAM